MVMLEAWTAIQPIKQWGYNHFFDASYSLLSSGLHHFNSFQYGLNDKIMLKDSIKYLSAYSSLSMLNISLFPTTILIRLAWLVTIGFLFAGTRMTINGYFATANCLDSSVKALFTISKIRPLWQLYYRSLLFGISQTWNPNLALLERLRRRSNYDNADAASLTWS